MWGNKIIVSLKETKSKWLMGLERRMENKIKNIVRTLKTRGLEGGGGGGCTAGACYIEHGAGSK